MPETLIDMETDEDRGRKRAREEHADGHDAAVLVLDRIVSSGGGVTDRKHIPTLLTAIAEETREGMRKVFLIAVERSSDDVKKMLVAPPEGTGQCGIQTIDTWAVETQKNPESATDFLLGIIKCLSSLPMDLECLKRTKVGKTIGALRKHTDQGLANAAKELVDKWRLLAGPGGGEGMGSAAQGSIVKKPKPPPISQGPSSVPSQQAGPGGPPAAKKARIVELKVDVNGALQTTTPGQPSPSTGLTPSPGSASHVPTLSEGRKAVVTEDKFSLVEERTKDSALPNVSDGVSPKKSLNPPPLITAAPTKDSSSGEAKKTLPTTEVAAVRVKLSSSSAARDSGGTSVPPVRLGSLKVGEMHRILNLKLNLHSIITS